MARDADDYGDGTRPFDASFGDATGGGPADWDATAGYTDPAGAGAQLGWFSAPALDSTAYITPAGDPFDDALAEGRSDWSGSEADYALNGTDNPTGERSERSAQDQGSQQDQSSRPEPDTRADPTTRDPMPTGRDAASAGGQRQPFRPQLPAPPAGQPGQPPAGGQQPAQRRPPAPPQQQRPPRRTDSPPQREPRQTPPPRRMPQPEQQISVGPAPEAQTRRTPPPAPSRRPSRPTSPRTLDDLTKRPPLRRQQQQPTRRPRSGPSRTDAMARFPTGRVEKEELPVEPVAPSRRARNVNPVWPILVFLVILVGLIRGCADSRNDSSSPVPAPVSSVSTGR